MGIRSFASLAVLLVAAGAHANGADAPAVLDAVLPGGRTTQALDALVARVALEPGQDFRVVELARDDRASHHVVGIRDREVPHVHERHDLFVVMLRGQGRMLLDDEERAVGPRSLLYVPRGTLHAFRNESGQPAYAYALYFPPFDGTDRVVPEPGDD